MFAQIKHVTELKKYSEHGTNAYLKMIPTGKIGFFDYGRGFLGVEVFVSGHEEGKYRPRIWFDTSDDGDYGGWGREMSKEDAVKLVDRIANEVFATIEILPTLEEMNLLLRPYGMFVGSE